MAAGRENYVLKNRTVLGLCFGSLFHIENFTIEGRTIRPRRPVRYSCTQCIKMDIKYKTTREG